MQPYQAADLIRKLPALSLVDGREGGKGGRKGIGHNHLGMGENYCVWVGWADPSHRQSGSHRGSSCAKGRWAGEKEHHVMERANCCVWVRCAVALHAVNGFLICCI